MSKDVEVQVLSWAQKQKPPFVAVFVYTTDMEVKRDVSYGVIPFFKEAEGWSVLVIHQYGSQGDVYWGFPKGHREGDEQGIDAAVRELKEETGVGDVNVDGTREFTQVYTFIEESTRIEKTVKYFIGYVSDKTTKIQVAEVADAKWCTPEEVRKLLTYENSQRIFEEAMRYVEERGFMNSSSKI